MNSRAYTVLAGLFASTCAAITMPTAASTRSDPVRFEPNMGQAAAGQFVGHSLGGLSLYNDDGVYFAVPQHGAGAEAVAVPLSLFRMEITHVAKSERLRWRATEARPSITHYILGKRTFKVSHYGSVAATVASGIEVQFSGHLGALKYNFVLAPGSDPAPLSIRFPGASVAIVDGALTVTDSHVTMLHRPPVAYQTCAGQEEIVSVQYLVVGDSVRFRLGARNPSCRLVIDPVVHFGLSGGSSVDEANSLAEVAGKLYLAGATLSPDIPLTVGTGRALQAALLETFDGTGALQAATVIGGTDGGSVANGIAVDGVGRITIVGWTAASDYPSFAAPKEFQNQAQTPSVQAFVTVFSDVSTVWMSAVFGGSGRDVAEAVAGQGKAIYIAGSTNSQNFPVKQAAQSSLAGGHDAFLLMLDDGTLTCSTLLGGRDSDGARAVAVGGGGEIVIGGLSYSADLPVSATAIDKVLTGLGYADGFVARYALKAGSLVPEWISYFGGDNQDIVTSVAVSDSGDLYIGGTTLSTDLPLKNAWRVQASGGEGFAARVSPTGSLIYATYVGGNDLDEVLGLRLDSNGILALVGSTRSAFGDPSFQKGKVNDILVGTMNPDGSLRKLISTGGSGDDRGSGVVVVGSRVWVAGTTTSADIPLVNSRTTHSGLADVFLMGIDLGEPIPAPSITSPSQRAQLSDSLVLLAWTVVPTAVGYDVVVVGGGHKRSTWVAAPASSLRVAMITGSHAALIRACMDSSRVTCGPAASVSFDVLANTQPRGGPLFIEPLAGAVFRSTLTFSWTPVAGATDYELEIRDQSDTRVLRIRVRETSTIYTIRSGSYRASVRACTTACGPSSSTDFQVALAVPLAAPTGLNCSSISETVHCSWSAVQGADLYVVHVVQPGAGPGGGALSVAAKQVSEASMTATVPPGRASVVVRACTGEGCGPDSAAVGVTITSAAPKVPILGSPVGGLTVDSGVHPPFVFFSWNRVVGDDGTNYRYRLFVQDFATQEAALDVHTSANYHAAYVNAGTRYDALVIATPLSGGASTTGPAQGFATRAKRNPDSPTPVAPAHGVTIRGGLVRLQWTKPAGDFTMFQYFLARSDGRSITGTSQTNSAVADLQSGTYTLAVRMCLTTCTTGSDAGWGPWSDRGEGGVSTFTVQ